MFRLVARYKLAVSAHLSACLRGGVEPLSDDPDQQIPLGLVTSASAWNMQMPFSLRPPAELEPESLSLNCSASWP